jgi:hypothetical protein
MWIVGLCFLLVVIIALLVLVARVRPQRFRLAASVAKVVTLEVELASEQSPPVPPTLPPPATTVRAP